MRTICLVSQQMDFAGSWCRVRVVDNGISGNLSKTMAPERLYKIEVTVRGDNDLSQKHVISTMEMMLRPLRPQDKTYTSWDQLQPGLLVLSRCVAKAGKRLGLQRAAALWHSFDLLGQRTLRVLVCQHRASMAVACFHIDMLHDLPWLSCTS
jgi:hypothetical protein